MNLYWLKSIGLIVFKCHDLPDTNGHGPVAYLTVQGYGGGGATLIALAAFVPEIPGHGSIEDAGALWMIGRVPPNLQNSDGLIVEAVFQTETRRFALDANLNGDNRQRLPVHVKTASRHPPTVWCAPDPVTRDKLKNADVIGSAIFERSAPDHVAPYQVARIAAGDKKIWIRLPRDITAQPTLAIYQEPADERLQIEDSIAVAVLRRREWRRVGDDPDGVLLEPRQEGTSTFIFGLRLADKLNNPISVESRQPSRLRLRVDCQPRDLIAILPLHESTLVGAFGSHGETHGAVGKPTSKNEKAQPTKDDPTEKRPTKPLAPFAIFEVTSAGIIPYRVDPEDPAAEDDEAFCAGFRMLLAARESKTALNRIVSEAPRRSIDPRELSYLWHQPILSGALDGSDFKDLAEAAPLIAAVEELWDYSFSEFFSGMGFVPEYLPLLCPPGPTEAFRLSVSSHSDPSRRGGLFESLVEGFWRSLPEDWPGPPDVQARILCSLIRFPKARQIAEEYGPGLLALDDLLGAVPSTEETEKEHFFSQVQVELKKAADFFSSAQTNVNDRSAAPILARKLGIEVLIDAFPSVAALIGRGPAKKYRRGAFWSELEPLLGALEALAKYLDDSIAGFSDKYIERLMDPDFEYDIQSADLPKAFSAGCFSENASRVRFISEARELAARVHALIDLEGADTESQALTLERVEEGRR